MSGPAVRDLIPINRISAARIRQTLRRDGPLARWSRSEPKAIRPGLLATLVRDCIWTGLDFPFGEVRERLAKPGDESSYRMNVEIEVGPKGRCEQLEVQVRFVRCTSGRIAVQIELCTAEAPIPLVTSRILLAEPASRGG